MGFEKRKIEGEGDYGASTITPVNKMNKMNTARGVNNVHGVHACSSEEEGGEEGGIHKKVRDAVLFCYDTQQKPTQRKLSSISGVSLGAVNKYLPKIMKTIHKKRELTPEEEFAIVPDIFSDDEPHIVSDVQFLTCPSQLVVQPEYVSKYETDTEFLSFTEAGQILYALLPKDKVIELASAEYGKKIRRIVNIIDDTRWQRVALHNGKIIYTDPLVDIRPGMRIIPRKGHLWRTTIKGFALREISICQGNSIDIIGYPNQDLYAALGINLMDPEIDIEHPTSEMIQLLKAEGINYSLAIQGVSPAYVGDDDVKEILLYAECSFDPDFAHDSAVSVCARAGSGDGKTKLLEGLINGLDFNEPYSVDDLTPAGSGMVKGDEVVVGLTSKKISIDELDKWKTENIEGLLPIVGGEKRKRIRHSIEFQVKNEAWCVATLLTTLGGYGGKRQKHVSALAQFMRRCVQLDITSKQPEDLIALSELTREQTRRRYTKQHGLTPEQELAVHELKKVRLKAKIVRDYLKLEGIDFFFGRNAKETQQIDAWLDKHCAHYTLEFCGATANWSPEMQRHIRNLAIGRTLAHEVHEIEIPRKELRKLYGEEEAATMKTTFVHVSFEDIKYIAAILERHAKKLGYWLTDKQIKEREAKKKKAEQATLEEND